jgi:sec-independent protein translocase protein TatA
MGIGFSELLVILVIVFVIFGAGKLPKVMGDMGKGLKSFRDGMKEDKAESDSKKE